MGGSFQGELLRSLPDIRFSSTGKGPSAGDLVAVRLGSETGSGDRKVRLLPRGGTTRVSTPSNLQEGTLLLGRVEQARDQLHVKLLQRRSEFQQITRDELTGLLRKIGIDSPENKLEAARRQLGNQGYLRLSGLRASGSSPDPGKFVERVNRAPGTPSLRGTVLTADSDLANSLNSGPDNTLSLVVEKSSSGGRVRLRTGDQRFQARTPVELQEGTRLTVRVRSGSEGTRLEILSKSPQPTNLSGLSESARSARLGAELRLLNNQASLPSLRAGETVTVEVLEGTDGGRTRLNVKGTPLEARSSVALRSGTELKATVHQHGGQTRLEVVSVTRDASQIPNPTLADVLEQMGVEVNRDHLHRLKNLLLKGSDGSVQSLMEQLGTQWARASVPETSRFRETLDSLLQTVRSSQDRLRSGFTRSIQNLDTSRIKDLLRELGIHPDQRTVKAARQLLEADPNPTKQVLQQALQNLSVAETASGSLEANRLRSLLFLVRNNLPVNDSILSKLASAGESLSAASQSADVNSALHPVNPGSGELASQIREALARVGFDLERRLTKDPDTARSTTRAQLAQAFPGGSGEGGNTSRGAQEMMGQILKHSLASVGEEGKTYLFVPFEDGDETKMMRVRLEDRRDAEGEADDEHWSVTVDLELSELGPLRVQANRSQTRLSLTFKASETGTRSLLRNHQEELRKPLEERGFEVYIRTSPMEPSSYGLLGETRLFEEGETTTFDVTV